MLKKQTNKQTNKQTKQTQESHTKNSISRGLGKKESYPNQITHIPPPPFHPSKVKWSTLIQSEFSVMCKLSNKKNKTSCGEKQQQQPELPKGEFRPARGMCM